MASGSIALTSNQPNYVSGRIDWQSTANVSGNYSLVNVQVYVILNGWGIQGTGSGEWKENGSTVETFSPYINIPYGTGGTVQVFTKNDIRVNHDNSSGNASINLGCKMSFSFAGISSIEGSETAVMDHIDRYVEITQFKAENIQINSATFRWKASDSCDKAYFSINGGTEQEASYPTFDYYEFEPNTTYNVKLRVRRQSNKLWTEKTIQIKTLDIARIINLTNMNIEGEQQITYKFLGGNYISFYIKTLDNEDFLLTEDEAQSMIDKENKVINLKFNEEIIKRIYQHTWETNALEVICYLETFGNGIYQNSKNIKLLVTDANPIVNDFTYRPTEFTELTGSNNFIKNYSGVLTKFTQDDVEVKKFYDEDTPLKINHIGKVRLECGTQNNEAKYTNISNFPISVSNVDGNILTLKIFDTRGNMGQLSKTINLIDYENILIKKATAIRNDGVSTIITLNLTGIYDVVNFGLQDNALTSVQYRKRKINQEYQDNWTNITSSASSNIETGEFKIANKELSGFEVGTEYEIELKVADKVSEYSTYINLNSGEPILCINKRKKMLGVGKIPNTLLSEGSLDIAGDIAIDGENFLKKVYPVGSIYLSINSANPNTYFGGRWQQIAQGRTLVGVNTSDSDFNAAQKTGGEKTHKLTINEMPNHRHEKIYSQNGKNERQAGWGTGSTHTGTLNGMTDHPFESLNTGYTGGGKAHNNMPPYFTCYIWIRTA